MSISLRRALTAMAVVAAVAVLAAPAVLAQPAPADNPKCGGVAGLMHHSLPNYTNGNNGRNFVTVQRVSPIQGSPGNLTNNGFHKLCNRMGLTATGSPATMADIDGDTQPDNAELIQYNGRDGGVLSYLCHQIVASSAWDEGSALEIRPDLTAGGSVSLIVPGVECSQRYAVYNSGAGKGVNYFPIPLSTTCSDRICLCEQLNLPGSSTNPVPAGQQTLLQMVDAAAGGSEDFLCGQAVDTFRPLPTGEAARIVPAVIGPGGGAPVNCLSNGASGPCPATPSTDYPAPLIY